MGGPCNLGFEEGEKRWVGSHGNDRKHVGTDSFTSDGVLALWGCIWFRVDVGSSKWHYFHEYCEGPPGANSPLTASLCAIVVWLWYGIKGRWHEQQMAAQTNTRQTLQLNIHNSQGINVWFQNSDGECETAKMQRGKCPNWILIP